MPEGTYTVTNPLGLHARAAANVCKLAEKFRCDIDFIANGMTANAKSILGLLTLAASKGKEIRVTTQGSDQDEALEAMKNLIADNFGEK